jgi:hypothetical protein
MEKLLAKIEWANPYQYERYRERLARR